MVQTLFVLICMSITSGQLSAQDAKKSNSPAQHTGQVKDLGLAKELIQRFQTDQDARKNLINFQVKHQLTRNVEFDKLDPKTTAAYQAAIKQVKEEDQRNLHWMKEVVAKHGWPGKSLVGVTGSHHAWLLIQHADADRDFQELCLKKMEAMPKGEVEPRSIAYLTDRVLVGRGKKQRYGTQTQMKNGKAIVSPIEEEGTVDERRKAIGLMPLAEYLKTLETFYTTLHKVEAKEETKKP